MISAIFIRVVDRGRELREAQLFELVPSMIDHAGPHGRASEAIFLSETRARIAMTQLKSGVCS